MSSGKKKTSDVKKEQIAPAAEDTTATSSPIADKAFSEFPLADSAVLNEIRDAESTAKQAAAQIAEMREQIQALTKKDELTPAEMEELQNKQKDIVCKLAEFEEVTRKIQTLVGLASLKCDGPDTGGGGNNPCGEAGAGPSQGQRPSTVPQGPPQLPRVIIPGLPPTQGQMAPVIMPPMGGEQVRGPGQSGWYQPAQPNQFPQTGFLQVRQPCEQPSQQRQSAMFNAPQMNQINQQSSAENRWTPAPAEPCPPEPCPPRPPSGCASGGQEGTQNFQQPQQSQLQNQDDCGPNIINQLTQKLDASYRIQEKLACENREMECERYQLQEELLSRDKQGEALAKQLESLQCELKLICSENNQLKKQVKCLADQSEKMSKCCKDQQKPLCKMSLCKDPVCKMDIYKQMGFPVPGCNEPVSKPCQEQAPCRNSTVTDMDQVVSTMEEEVRAMQKELQSVQAERRSLDLQKKLLKCATPGPSTCFPSQAGPVPVCKKQVEVGGSTASAPKLELPPPPCPPPCPPPKPPPQCMRELECQLKELRQQYTQLTQDFNDKVAEISVLRIEADNFREEKKCLLLKREDDQNRVDNLLTRIKQLEEEKERLSGAKGAMLDTEQQMIMYKQKFIEKQELEDEMKILINDQTSQLEDYRNKYLKAQEIVEGQRRDMDVMQKNHLRFSEQLTKELKQAKEEFQKRLEELSRLPDILKNTQQKLQESQQMRIIAEQSVEQLTVSVEELREKLEIMQIELEKVSNVSEDKGDHSRSKLKLVVSELEEKVLELERQLEGKRQHVIMLEGQIDQQREESARAVTRTKERCDVVRRGLQTQIADLEVQLAQARASARSAQKDRDMIRDRMECQISKLTKNFEEAQNWVKCLQSHVGFLKTSSKDIEFAAQPPECLPKTFQPIPID